MKRTLSILMCLIIFSCKKEDVNNPPYFAFDNTGREWFSDLKVHDTLKFIVGCRHSIVHNEQVLLQVGYFITSSPEPLPN
jgi:hypothetical protein